MTAENLATTAEWRARLESYNNVGRVPDDWKTKGKSAIAQHREVCWK
jgi:hypothetical protein